MLPTAADGYRDEFSSSFQDFITSRPQLPERAHTSHSSMLPENSSLLQLDRFLFGPIFTAPPPPAGFPAARGQIC